MSLGEVDLVVEQVWNFDSDEEAFFALGPLDVWEKSGRLEEGLSDVSILTFCCPLDLL